MSMSRREICLSAENVHWPRGLTGWLVNRFISRQTNPRETAARTLLGELEGFVSTGISVVLAGVKATLGLLSGSVSLLADSLNNMADIGSSLLIALSFRWSRRPRDREHPFGHGRVETAATLVLALFLLGVGLEVARSGVRRLNAPEPIHAPNWLLAAVGSTVVLKTWMAGFARSLARLTGSQVIEADSWNHIFDVVSSALVGVALVSSRFGYPRADGFAAVGVALFIAYTGWRYAREAVNEIIGLAPPPAELEAVRAAALSVPGVRGVHDVIIHKYGDVRLVSLHIEVCAEQSVMDAHQLAERVEAAVSEAASAKVVAHIDPVDRSHPSYARVEEALRHFSAEHPDVAGYHDLRIQGAADAYDFSVDLVVRTQLPRESFGAFLEEARKRLREDLNEAQNIELGIEAEYASDPEQRKTFRR